MECMRGRKCVCVFLMKFCAGNEDGTSVGKKWGSVVLRGTRGGKKRRLNTRKKMRCTEEK